MSSEVSFLHVREFSCRYCAFKCYGNDREAVMAHTATHPENAVGVTALKVYAHVPLVCGLCSWLLATVSNEVRCTNERCGAFGRVFEFPERGRWRRR